MTRTNREIRRVRPIEDQTILITGATDGMGRRLARELAAQGAKLLLHGRDQARGETTLAEISEATGKRQVDVLQS